MGRLFLKLYGVLIATLFLSFLIQGELIDYVYRQLAPHFDFRARFRPTFHLLGQALARTPAEEIPARFEALSAGFGLPARLDLATHLPERARLDPAERASFDAGAMTSLMREGGFTVVQRLDGTPYAAALDVPGPDSRHIRMVTYAVNWTVEFTMVAVLVWFWVRPFWAELAGLRAAAERVGDGRFEARAVTGRGSALREVAQAFNAMAARLGTLVQSHRELTSAVSHELRSPVARLRFALSLAQEAPGTEARDRYLARMEQDLAEIEELATELLDHARFERGMPPLRTAEIDAAAWLEAIVAPLRRAECGAPRIETFSDLDRFGCEPKSMGRAVANLVRNGCAHARSLVRVRIGRDGAATTIDVEDDGPGVPAADRERVFEPFVRLDLSRDRRTGGFGLGLAIVRQVARWHRGDATIQDSPLGGARVRIAW